MVSDDATQDLTGSVINFALQPTGTPQRPTRTALVTSPSTNGTINQNFVRLEAQATDPCNSIQKTTFYRRADLGQWLEVGTDEDGSDGWSVYWDTSGLPDQSINIKAFASDRAGNGVTSPINSHILLDRQPPTVTTLTFAPGTAEPGEIVTMAVNIADNLSGIKRADIYIDPSTDGSAPWDAWNLLGTISGTQGSLVWNTNGYTFGFHEIVLVLEDNAGNQTFWPLPGGTPLRYKLKAPFEVSLPLIMK